MFVDRSIAHHFHARALLLSRRFPDAPNREVMTGAGEERAGSFGAPFVEIAFDGSAAVAPSVEVIENLTAHLLTARARRKLAEVGGLRFFLFVCGVCLCDACLCDVSNVCLMSVCASVSGCVSRCLC